VHNCCETQNFWDIALELEPNNAAANGNYALFLEVIRKNYDQAEKHYKKALRLRNFYE
jgi:Tfp pilus assembly protein PilF